MADPARRRSRGRAAHQQMRTRDRVHPGSPNYSMTLPTPVIPIGVSCEMIIEKDGKILLGKRGNVFGEGSWALPGGHLEVGERTVDCLRRELKEEADIEPINFCLLGIINDLPNIPGQIRHTIRFVYLVSEFRGEIINKEKERCEGWEWFNVSLLPKPIFCGHVKVLELYQNRDGNFFVDR